MDLYKQYLKERDGAELHFDENGFVTFSIKTDHFCYLSEIYVVKAKRGSMAAIRLYNLVLKAAVAQNCKALIGSVDITTNNWQLSEKIMKKMKFQLLSVDGNMRYFWLKL